MESRAKGETKVERPSIEKKMTILAFLSRSSLSLSLSPVRSLSLFVALERDDRDTEAKYQENIPPLTWAALAAAARRRNSAVRSVAAALDDDDDETANVEAPPPKCAMVSLLLLLLLLLRAQRDRQSETGSGEQASAFLSPLLERESAERKKE